MFSYLNSMISSPTTNFEQLSRITINVLGKEYTVSAEDVSPEMSLNEYLRNTLHMKGTKHMCLEGGCGACIVAARKVNTETKKEEIFAVNSCLIPLLACNEWKIETIDGIGGGTKDYHAVQKALADFNGTQCGYCSPGMVMNMYALYESGEVTMAEVDNSFGGNICRCTGYRPILAAFKSLCKDADESMLGTYPEIADLKICRTESCQKSCPMPCSKKRQPFMMMFEKSRWVKVYTMADLLKELKTVGDSTYMLIAGNTGQGVFRITTKPEVYIDVKDVPELLNHKIENDKLIIGGNASLTYTMNLFYKLATENKSFAYLEGLGDHIDLIANVPVRNTGTLAGNLMMKHDNHGFPSDLFLIFETVHGYLTIVDENGSETSVSLADFLQFDMKRKVLKSVVLPSLDETYKYVSYKIMPRAQNAHALVNAGFLFQFDKDVVKSASIVYGCINPTFIHAKHTEDHLVGKSLCDNEVLKSACQYLSVELSPDIVPAEPEPKFRKQLAIALFYKTVLSIASPRLLTPKNQSGGEKLKRPVSTGTQDFETKRSLYPVTQAIPKIEALAQTSGQAEYVEDIPDHPNQLYAKLVLADAVPSSTIKKIDPSGALALPGVVAFYGKDDIPGENNFMIKSFFPHVEEIFCNGTVLYHSQPIGVLVGKNKDILNEASLLVKVEYTAPTTAPLTSIPDILAANAQNKIIPEQTYPAKRKGDNVKHVIKGVFDIRSQHHFHMELQACRVLPTEDGLEVYPTTQWPTLNQIAIAAMLNIPANKVHVTARRCGGAFGAKISRGSQLICAAALACWKLKKPVAAIMMMEDNLTIMGRRWPFYCDYEAGVNDSGVFQYLNAKFYSDFGQQGGNERPLEIISMFSSNYDSDTFDIKTFGAYSDVPGNTWCRSPGSTEALGAIESIMDHIAYEINLDPVQVRIVNISKNQQILDYMADLKRWASIEQRKQDIEKFNKENRWKKKGFAMVPMTYELRPLGGQNVYITIYQHDGSVALAHSGVEIGQGINTKAAQVCAFKLGIPLDKVVVRPTSVFLTGDSFPTGASFTSEAVCYGIMQACDILLERLKPYRKDTWEETIVEAGHNFVNLSATGQYAPNRPDVKEYLIYGACATEVIVDVLTGQHLITRVDLIEDTGVTISPLVDIGQVEGAFMMGVGYYTIENIIYDDQGRILTNRTWNYKPPGAKDIPIDFRVKFPKNSENAVGVLKSKATGEPPLCMSVTVPLAIRNAVASARSDADSSKPKWFPFSGPTTVEQTFMNCMNDYSQYVL